MTRSHHSRASSLAPGAARHKASLQQRKPSYKVVLEQVTEKKKKLLTHLVFSTAAPRGYTFIPAGDPQLTNRCKEFARQDGSDVFIVSATSEKRASILSHEVHRVGYHFPSAVVEKACTSLSVTLSSLGRVIYNQSALPLDATSRSRKKKKPRKRGTVVEQPTPRLEASQAEIDTEASQAIRDLFPRIPQEDLDAVVRLAFKKGSNLVGTADLPLHRRAQLGVLAHIRHVYTNYEQLLRMGEWKDARTAVEHLCLDKLVQWRGDDEDDTDAMSDILREIIVIPDDEDDLNSRARSDNLLADIDREASVEVIATRAAADAVHMQQINFRHPSNSDSNAGSESDEVVLGAYRPKPTEDRRQSDRIEAHRHRAWAAARDRRRREPMHLQHRRSPTFIECRRPPPSSHEVPANQYLKRNPESLMNQQGLQDTKNLFASAARRLNSPPRTKRVTSVVDLTTSSPYTSHGYPQQSSHSFSSSDQLGNIPGRSNDLTMTHHPISTWVTHPKNNMTMIDGNVYHTGSSITKLPPERVLPSIEQPVQDTETRKRAQEGYDGILDHDSSIASLSTAQTNWRLPAARVPAGARPIVARKRRYEVEEPPPSPHNRSQPGAGTVLIPLEEYNERRGKDARISDMHHSYTPAAYVPQEYSGRHLLMTDNSILHSPDAAVEHPRRIRSPQTPIRGSGGEYQRRPHLQVQLKSGAAGFCTDSPINLVSSPPDYQASPMSQIRHPSAQENFKNSVMSGNNNAPVQDGYIAQTSSYGRSSEARSNIRHMPVRTELAEMASYDSRSGSARPIGVDPFLGLGDRDRSHNEPRQPYRQIFDSTWSPIRENKGIYSKISQRTKGPHVFTGNGHHHIELPFRTRQGDNQIHNFLLDVSHDDSLLPARPVQEEIFRYTDNSKPGDRPSDRIAHPRMPPASRPQILTYVSYERKDDQDWARMGRDPFRVQGGREDLVVID